MFLLAGQTLWMAIIVVTGIALQREADLVLQGLEILLVLRPALHRDAQALEPVRARDLLRVAGGDDDHSVRVHVRHGACLLGRTCNYGQS